MALFLLLSVAAAFNNPPGVSVWDSSFNPGGQIATPAKSESTLLNLQVRPRMNIYTASDSKGSFIVDAALSDTYGSEYADETEITVTIAAASTLATGTVAVGGTSEIEFDLSSLTPQTTPYDITVTGTYSAQTTLTYLPDRTDGGSVVKLDSLYGGLVVNGKPFLPFSYYMDWNWLQQDIDRVADLLKWGYNIVHAVPDGTLPNGFDFDDFDEFLDYCDEIGMYVMYDMRWSYQNLTSVTQQVNNIKSHPSVLLYYTGDEPDGNADPLDAPKTTYDKIKSLDPYHPVSLCLNCYNFYYEDYSAGADIILGDPYPVGINATWSTVWNTPCNSTYGDCGCDSCVGNFSDVSGRQDLYASYQKMLNLPPKTTWGVPQGFGEDSYWPRYPTGAEVAVMDMLSINHGAKGLVSWDFPTSADINSTTSALAKAVTAPSIASLLLGATPSTLSVSGATLDAVAWVVDGTMLVSLVSTDYDSVNQTVTVTLPQEASVSDTVWGESWTASGKELTKAGLKGLEVDVLVLSIK